jgi:hypothetical protein
VTEYGRECRVDDCHGEPHQRIISPFGEGVFCEDHAEALAPEMGPRGALVTNGARQEWLIQAFRYGPGRDPEFTL